ncbi:MAG: DHH family phosphoesterase [Cyanophyceae cyanobacterium]
MRPSRWAIAPATPEITEAIANETGLSPLLAQVLVNRGVESVDAAQVFLDPDLVQLPNPIAVFEPLTLTLELLEKAIAENTRIGICGDYDADGMTSTALLLRALRTMGANVCHAIPSRMKDGYGINRRIVDELFDDGVRLILTVDNGIAAVDPVAYARDLGMTVILTDHHDIPPEIPPANAILNPKLIDEESPYRGLAGVGVAYILAVSLGHRLGFNQIWRPLLELFTLGTIADLAPLTGVNRRWVKRGLELLPYSAIPGVRALQQVTGLAVGEAGNNGNGNGNGASISANGSGTNNGAAKTLKPEAIGFRLGPRINAVGRLDDPQIVIDLLTTDDAGVALERAMQCEDINQQRQALCRQIEEEAIAWVERQAVDLRDQRVLVVVQPGWHHGVIGIVASRLVERYGAPVFIGTFEPEEPDKIRGSARGIPEFNVFDALHYAGDLLGKFGGHPAAGGFSMDAANLGEFIQRLSEFACKTLEAEYIQPLVAADVQAAIAQVDEELFSQIDMLHPCGIGNREPVFWTPAMQVLGQRKIGKDRSHLKCTLSDGTGQIEAIAWRRGDDFPLPEWVDVAYRLTENEWQGNVTIELNVVGFRPAEAPAPAAKVNQPVAIQYGDRTYVCGYWQRDGAWELRIRNEEGNILAAVEGASEGLLGRSREEAKAIDLTKPFFRGLIEEAKAALD